jgi:hypothetical protein
MVGQGECRGRPRGLRALLAMRVQLSVQLFSSHGDAGEVLFLPRSTRRRYWAITREAAGRARLPPDPKIATCAGICGRSWLAPCEKSLGLS